jgi:hypothetical protein
MFNSTTLEVAIGMAFIYLLLSLFCTAINEALAGFLGTRAKNLEKGIRSLFTDGLKTAAASGEPAVTLAEAIYNHGLIQSLYRSGPAEVTKWYTRIGSSLPSYIPAGVFASALIDILFPEFHIEAGATTTDAPTGGANAATGSDKTGSALESMLSALEKLPPSKGKEAIVTLVKQADGDIATVRQSFEGWYNDGMDRVSGWYKRKTQTVLFVIGILIAVGLNVDSIAIGKTLWISPATRSYAVAAAEDYAKEPAQANMSIHDTLSKFEELSLPIGWDSSNLPWMDKHWQGTSHWQSFSKFGLLSTLVGWFLTALAMTLGAPFWFDTLNQFMVVRSTVKPKEKSGVEASKDASS